MLSTRVQRLKLFCVDVCVLASEHMNMFIQHFLWCYLVCIHLSLYAQKSTWHPSYLWHAISAFSLDTHTDSSLFHALPPFLPFFHFTMECLMWGVKKSCRVEQCGSAALWPAPSPNLILAVLKIVCVPSRTDRPLFPESLRCPRRSKRPLCASSTALRPHEIFTGQHLVWDRERGARESTTLPPITTRPQLY